MQSIVITGASSGIGKATAKYFAAQGWKVAATMRTPSKETELTEIENVSVYQLDVTDNDSISAASTQILSDFETVDVLLNNAGYGLAGPFEAATREQIRTQFDTNVFGLMEVTRAFLPHLRGNKSGVILNVSSIGGLITFPYISLYHSTKWAVEGFSESLYYELAQVGVQVKIIEPGGVSTDFGGRSLVMAMPDESLAEYLPSVQKFMANREANGSAGFSTAEYLAEEIFKAATDGTDQLRYVIGADAVQLFDMRKEHGDQAFIAGMAQRSFS
ncbi:MAG: SDR family oxidoreductase [Chloroflexota bacterium]